MARTRTLAVKRETLTELTPEYLGAIAGGPATPNAWSVVEWTTSVRDCDRSCRQTCTAISKTRSVDG